MREPSDTAVFVGGEAYSAERSVYLYAASAGPTLEIAVEELGQHFARKGNVTETERAGPSTRNDSYSNLVVAARPRAMERTYSVAGALRLYSELFGGAFSNFN